MKMNVLVVSCLLIVLFDPSFGEEQNGDNEKIQKKEYRFGSRSYYSCYEQPPVNGGIKVLPSLEFGAMVFLIGVFVIWIFFSCCLSNAHSEDTIQCYLCEKRVKTSEWENGIHRSVCSHRLSSVLHSLPVVYLVTCPRCRRALRQWPANRGPPFKCDGPQCNAPGEIRNTGQNRFNCFLCDYDLCGQCAMRASASAPSYASASVTYHLPAQPNSTHYSDGSSWVIDDGTLTVALPMESSPPKQLNDDLPTYEEAVGQSRVVSGESRL